MRSLGQKILKSKGRIGRSLRAVRRFGRNVKGAVVIEFALLAVPFFAIVGAILETSFLLLASAVLDDAIDQSARKIRTGQAQAANFDSAAFKEDVCNNLYGLFDCSGLRIMVSPIASFTSASLADDVVDPDTGEWEEEENFVMGSGSTIMLAQVYYKWPTHLDFLSFDLASLPDNTRLISAARLFQTEPF